MTNSPPRYRVRNWDRFQHYKSRNPPWIKLHFEILSSADWVMLDDNSKLLAIACMLIASRNEGCVPNNPEYVKRVAYLNKTPKFKPLIDCGFLEILQADASIRVPLQAGARPEEETEAEAYSEEVEEKERTQGTRLQDNWALPPDFREFASKEGMRHDDIEREAENFKDYWVSVVGQRGIKRNWIATWRNWIRRRDQFNGAGSQRRNGYSHADKTSNMLDGLRIAALSEAPSGGDGSTDQPAGVGEGAGSTGEARSITDRLDS
jgi:hypothetical protein